MTVPGQQHHEDDLELAAAFPATDRERWRELVRGVLRKSGKAGDDTPLDEIESLISTTTYDGIAVAPLYTAEDAAPGRPGLPPYARIVPGGDTVAGWDVRQRQAHPDPAVTREAVRTDLETGGTSVWLVLGDGGVPVSGLAEALADVHLDLAPVVLDAGAETVAAAEALLALAESRGVTPSGSLGADPLGLAARTGEPADLAPAVALAGRVPAGLRVFTVDATVYHDAGASDAEELAASVATGVAYLRALTAAGHSVDAALAWLEFRYAATADQFLTIAKLRAARRLWARVAEVCGGADSGQRQHAVTSSAMMTARDPWVNMLRTTVAAFAAGVGGADAVTVQPFDARLGLPDDFSRRIARNTQALLLEEASLGRVADPAGGSWYVERLTADLATAAWTLFQEIEGAGGLPAAAGLLAGRIAGTWEKRRRNLGRRRDPITGVSEFPNLGEQRPARTPAPARAGGGLPRVNYAQDFEVLRDAADAAPERPAVFLATIGTVAQYTARSSFAANLFQAGGIATPEAGPGTDPAAIARAFRESGARAACLCSADPLYAEHAAAVATALKEAGAGTVWLAGKGDYEGVDSTLYAGCDALGVLRATLTDLGVPTEAAR